MNDIRKDLKDEILPEPGFNRRRFLGYFATLGLTTTLLPGCGSAGTAGDAEITVETIAEAEKIIGITLTPKEREKILKSLKGRVKVYQSLREKKIDNSVSPALVFNPILPGKTFSTEKKPFTYTKVRVKRPAKLEDAAFYSVLQLAHLLETGQVTSTELTRMYLTRLKRYDPKLKFVVNLTEELALKQAAKADKEIQSGNYRGLLHGIPYGAKDLFAAKGYKTTWGAEPYKNQVIDRDATVIEKLEAAGAVLVAKLTLGALATGDVWFGGKTRNPWNPEQGSSGSSAGPASAVAAGCVAFALGSETNGSILSPCDRCGVTGLRPTFGRVSRYGAMALTWSMDKVGPICRSVEDCAVVFNAIYGPDGRDNTLIDLPFNWDPGLDVKTLRIGYFSKYFEKEQMGSSSKNKDYKKYMKAKRELSNKALDVMRGLGVNLRPLDFDLPVGDVSFILATEAAAAFDDLTLGDRDDMMKDSHWPDSFRVMRFVPAVEYIQANRARTQLMEKMDEVMKDIDVYIEITHSNTHLTNLTGHPAVIVPCGFYEGRPVGIVFIGKLFGEGRLLAAAKAFQDATDFHLKRPKL